MRTRYHLLMKSCLVWVWVQPCRTHSTLCRLGTHVFSEVWTGRPKTAKVAQTAMQMSWPRLIATRALTTEAGGPLTGSLEAATTTCREERAAVGDLAARKY